MDPLAREGAASRDRRLSIGYIVPGHSLLGSAGPTRNVLYLARSLGRWADVTVAFRRVLEPIEPDGFRVLEIDPRPAGPTPVDDAAVRDTGLANFLGYLRAIRRFVAAHRSSFDVVLEKSWLLSGHVTSMYVRRGVPAAVVENVVRVWSGPRHGPKNRLRYARHVLVQRLVGRYLRRAPIVIAETAELREALTRRWRIEPERIEVVGLGVNAELFRPAGRDEARRELGISPEATVLLYAGTLDRAHDLSPVLGALGRIGSSSIELHVVGDGELRGAYEELAGNGRSAIFHGRVPHERLPRYIAASDLCLAPYAPGAFPGGAVAYSTLKIPEYMACARPVASVPSGHVTTLVRHGVSGFLIPPEPERWLEFLRSLPPRRRLDEMGDAARRLLSTPGWEEVARAYLGICERLAGGTDPRGRR